MRTHGGRSFDLLRSGQLLLSLAPFGLRAAFGGRALGSHAFAYSYKQAV